MEGGRLLPSAHAATSHPTTFRLPSATSSRQWEPTSGTNRHYRTGPVGQLFSFLSTELEASVGTLGRWSELEAARTHVRSCKSALTS